VDIYTLFKNNKDYGFRDQIQRASVSIMNNIAEGFERRSNKELKQFLYIAKGSCGEVRSMIRLAESLQYIIPINAEEKINQATQISKMLSGFIKKL
jgi:four helix bundle protein